MESIWKDKAAPTLQFPTLASEESADVVIVGAGITGLTAAYLLSKEGKKVIVLEKSRIGDGTTGFSSCHLTTGLDYEYQRLFDQFDEATVREIASSRKAGIDFVEKTVKALNISCDFRRLNGYYYTEREEDVKTIEKEYGFALKAGLKVKIEEKAPLPFANKKSLVFENQAFFNSQKYLLQLAQHLQQSGNCHIFENSRATDMDTSAAHVMTSNGSVKAKHIFLATHYPIFFNVLQTMAAPYRSYLLAVKLQNDNYPGGLFWDTMAPYHYTCTYEVNNEKYLIVGGADHKTGHQERNPNSYGQLEEYVRDRYDVENVAYRWSAQFYEPADGIPYIGKSPFDDIYVATGFSGDGLVYGTIAGMIISDMIAGNENYWAEIYDSRRFKPLASAGNFIKENIDVAKDFITDRFKGETEVADLMAGEGRLIKSEHGQVAVARDMEGKLHYLSPVCPHLKCIVHWNANDRSWDCPCHGSRFTLSGELITGPSVSDLQKARPTKK